MQKLINFVFWPMPGNPKIIHSKIKIINDNVK